MPRLPDVAGSSQAPTPQPSGGIAVASPEIVKSNAGQIISSAGNEMQEAAAIIAATNNRQDQRDALNAANKLQEESIKLQYDPERGYQNARGEQAVGSKFSEKYAQQFKDHTQQIRNGLANDNQRRAFDKHAQVLGAQYQSGLLKHQSQETERFNDQTDDNAIKLQLRTMAQDPVNDINFHTGLVKINGVIDAIGKRKGLPAEQTTELKNQYLDAAYTTRITAVMNGIPGVSEPNPKLAETMFKQVQGSMGPQAQTQLASQVQKSVIEWQDTTVAKSLIFGQPPGAPKDPSIPEIKSDLPQNPTANDLKVDLGKRVQLAMDLYPNDPVRGRALAAKVENYGRIVISNQVAEQASARDMLVKGMIGTRPDGSDAPLTMDQLLRNPDARRAWDAATPETKQAVQTHFKNGGGSPPRTPETQALLYSYMGMAANDRDGFANADLSTLIPKLPYQDFDKLANLQLAARNRTERDQEKAANLQHALTLSLNYALKPLGIGVPTQGTSASKREQYDQFTGRLAQWMDDYRASNGKNPTDQDIVKQAKSLTATLTVPGTLWDSNKPGFTLTPEEEAKATVKLTPEQSTGIKSSLQSRYGFEPTESMVQQAAVLNRLYPNDLKRLRQFDQTMRDLAKKQGGQK